MTSKMFAPLTGTSSKAEEIAALEKFAALCGSGSYLASVFTNQFLGWVEQGIKDDVCPDIFDALVSARSAEQMSAVAIRRASETIDRLQAQLNSVIARAETEGREKSAAIETLKNSIRENEAVETENYKRMYAEIEEKISAITKFEKLLDEAQDQIVALKCEVYDLVHEDHSGSSRQSSPIMTTSDGRLAGPWN
jgi:hypothetical protein